MKFNSLVFAVAAAFASAQLGQAALIIFNNIESFETVSRLVGRVPGMPGHSFEANPNGGFIMRTHQLNDVFPNQLIRALERRQILHQVYNEDAHLHAHGLPSTPGYSAHTGESGVSEEVTSRRRQTPGSTPSSRMRDQQDYDYGYAPGSVDPNGNDLLNHFDYHAGGHNPWA
ncbi:uncharacterized protein PFL1_01523 [Pseudozyma flocculosa PF-1]|uniref:Uncharacterized protein n=1 Tax=Pseudozyma flocculosa TaxID=84751 RepID=A0A5C3FBH6_9BASI|nr:uncharacterized protein PFL1_01523 [Pseudozyma flocculosa PF-1]EPQ31339.1 hypothetical protein PFL1_01523 [Pseudozyma flocculosa PF-1]SPO41804.1 uncharacterized protein PSFLO_07286 [Pseudozyma flocculosa]